MWNEKLTYYVINSGNEVICRWKCGWLFLEQCPWCLTINWVTGKVCSCCVCWCLPLNTLTFPLVLCMYTSTKWFAPKLHAETQQSFTLTESPVPCYEHSQLCPQNVLPEVSRWMPLKWEPGAKWAFPLLFPCMWSILRPQGGLAMFSTPHEYKGLKGHSVNGPITARPPEHLLCAVE